MVRLLKRCVFAVSLALTTTALTTNARAQEPAPPPPPPPPATQAAPITPPPPPPGPPPGPYYAPQAPPGLRPPPPPPRGPAHRVQFEPDEPELALMMRTGEMPVEHLQRFRHVWYYERGFAPVYSPICDGPCTTELAAGVYHLGLAKDGGRAVPAGGVLLTAPSTIRASYDDRSGARVAGAVILVAGIIGGIVMVVASADHQTCDDAGDCRGDVNGPLLAGGVGVIIGSAVLGTILASQRDHAHLTVTPLSLPTVGALKESPVAALRGAAAPQGAALTLKF